VLIKDLKPNSPVKELVLTLVRKGEVRNLHNREGRICNVHAKDEEGRSITLTLWDDDVEKFHEGDKIKIVNGWCKLFHNKLEVMKGKFGTIEKVVEDNVGEAPVSPTPPKMQLSSPTQLLQKRLERRRPLRLKPKRRPSDYDFMNEDELFPVEEDEYDKFDTWEEG